MSSPSDSRPAIEQEIDALIAARRKELEDRVRQNLDGTFLVQLVSPVTIDDEVHDRVTVGRVKTKHVLEVGRGEDLVVSVKDLAPLLVRPVGIIGELELAADHSAVLVAAERALGKYQSGGWSSSPSPRTGSDGRGETSST